MTQWQSFAQAIQFQRTVWNNAFSMCSAVQLNGKDMLESSLHQCSWLTNNEKQGYLEWAENFIQTTENLKSLVDNSFQEVEKHVSDEPPLASAVVKKEAPSVSRKQPTAKAAPKTAAAPATKKAPSASRKQASTQAAPKAAAATAKKKAPSNSPRQANAQAAPKATAAPAKKKAPAKRSTARSKSTGEAQVKKASAAQKKPAAARTTSDPAANKTSASTPERSSGAAPGTENKSVATEKPTASKQQP